MKTIIKTSTITNFLSQVKSCFTGISTSQSIRAILADLSYGTYPLEYYIQGNVPYRTLFSLSNGEFRWRQDIKGVRILSGTIIPGYAFGYCCNLEEVIMPTCLSISWAAFDRGSIQYLSVPNVMSIEEDVFTYCSIGSAIFKSLSYIGRSIFTGATLGNIEFTNVSTVGYQAFSGATIYNLSLPNCTSLNSNAFNYAVIQNISLPKCEIVSKAAFMGTDIKYLNLPMCTTIGSIAFRACNNLSLLSLGGSSVVNLHSLAFSNCTNIPTILVPSSLYSSYITNATWKSISYKITSQL